MIKPPPDYRRKIAPQRVFFTWDITYKCNYRCSYCNFNEPGGWMEPEPTVYPGLDTWVEVWRKIYEKYGSCEIHFAGGEPFVYPNFMDLIERLSKMHTLEFSTNFYWDPADFIRSVGPGRARIGVSFHPEFVSFETFFEKVRKLKEAGFEVWVNYVAYPPIFKGMQEFKQNFKQIGVAMSLLPFKGEYEDRKYPEGYTEEEKQYLKKCAGADLWTQKTMDFAFVKEKRETKSRLCQMGQMYAKIHSNGDTFSCCAKTARKLGNLVAGTFSLLEEPFLCKDDNCPCWKGMVIGKEEHWAEHWVVPPDARQLNKLNTSRNEREHTNTKFKIALVQGPVWGIFDPPIALAQLSSTLTHKGFEVGVFDLNIELYRARMEEYKNAWAIEQSSFWCNRDNVLRFFLNNSSFIEDWINKIIAFVPKIIGFSVNNASLFSTLELIRRLRQKDSRIKIILGGPLFFVDADIESIIGNDYVDMIVLGEGEITFCELIGILEDGKDPNICKGILYKKEGKIIKTEPRPLINNLDELPFLDFTDLSLDKYDPPGHLGKHISLMTSRGCIQNCAFCGPKAYWRGYRSMSGKRIYEEIKYHLQKNPEIEHIEFLDLLFNGNMKTLNEFCDQMISGPVKPHLKWHANVVIRPEMTAEVLSKMKKAGCHHLTYGIESGSQQVLGLMRKHYRIKDADQVLKYTHEAGIEVTCNFMFGFPGETEGDFQQTLDFLKRNAKYITTAYPSRSYCTVEPHSYLEEHIEEFDMIPNPVNNTYWESKDGRNTYPERLKRCEIFSSLASSLGIFVGSGLQTSIELDRWYNLGFYYESKKDYRNAIECFSRYLAVDSKNEMIINKLEGIKNYGKAVLGPSETANVDKNQGNGQVSFNWDIHWICNYRCPYCWFYGKWAELKSRNRTLSVRELIDAWSNVYRRYGTVKVSITGGEPFLYPNFMEFIKEFSQIHKVEIITNLSTDIQEFVKAVNSKNVKVNPSFHSLFSDFDRFIEKVRLLKENGLLQCVSYLAWPPLIKKIGYYTERFNQYNISIAIQSFFGEYNGLRYPDGYSEEEKEIILPQIGERGGKPFQTEPLKTKGKRCAAGYRYGVIHPDGMVLRCGGIHSSVAVSSVGNIFEGGFRLFDNLFPCTFEICPCNEWAFLLDE